MVSRVVDKQLFRIHLHLQFNFLYFFKAKSKMLGRLCKLIIIRPKENSAKSKDSY